MTKAGIAIALLLTGILLALGFARQQDTKKSKQETQASGTERSSQAETGSGSAKLEGKNKVEVATFGAGCFWCVEAVFQRLEGVNKVESGYCNGKTKNPTYKEVCTGLSGHAEVCRIEYDPEKISFTELLEVFWKTHDPTTLNRQGADSGTQYRSAVFFHNDEQKQLAIKYKKRLDESGAFGDPIVTEIAAADTFYPAENYHDDYFNQNPNQGYCRAVIQPKLEKFKKAFADKLKK